MAKNLPLKVLVAGTVATLLLTIGAHYIVFGGEELAVEPLERIEGGEVPGKVLLWLDRGKMERGYGAFWDGENLFLAVKMGQCPTGGYSVVLGDFKMENDVAVVTTEFLKPNPWDIVIHVLTYPSTVAKLAAGGSCPLAASFIGVDGIELARVDITRLDEE